MSFPIESGLKHPGLELLAQSTLVEDSSIFKLEGIPNDRKYYVVYFSFTCDTANSSSRIRVGSAGTDNYARRTQVYGSTDQTGTDDDQLVSGNLAATDGNCITGTMLLVKQVGIQQAAGNGFNSFLDTMVSDNRLSTAVPTVISGRTKIELDTFDSIEMFFASGNVVSGSWVEVYGSTKRVGEF